LLLADKKAIANHSNRATALSLAGAKRPVRPKTELVSPKLVIRASTLRK
jgi:hypothetical protein